MGTHLTGVRTEHRSRWHVEIWTVRGTAFCQHHLAGESVNVWQGCSVMPCSEVRCGVSVCVEPAVRISLLNHEHASNVHLIPTSLLGVSHQPVPFHEEAYSVVHSINSRSACDVVNTKSSCNLSVNTTYSSRTDLTQSSAGAWQQLVCRP